MFFPYRCRVFFFQFVVDLLSLPVLSVPSIFLRLRLVLVVFLCLGSTVWIICLTECTEAICKHYGLWFWYEEKRRDHKNLFHFLLGLRFLFAKLRTCVGIFCVDVSPSRPTAQSNVSSTGFSSPGWGEDSQWADFDSAQPNTTSTTQSSEVGSNANKAGSNDFWGSIEADALKSNTPTRKQPAESHEPAKKSGKVSMNQMTGSQPQMS